MFFRKNSLAVKVALTLLAGIIGLALAAFAIAGGLVLLLTESGIGGVPAFVLQGAG